VMKRPPQTGDSRRQRPMGMHQITGSRTVDGSQHMCEKEWQNLYARQWLLLPRSRKPAPCLSHDFPPFWPPISGTNNFYSIHIFMRGHSRAVGSDHTNVDSLSSHCPNQFPYECPVSIACPTRKGSRNKANLHSNLNPFRCMPLHPRS